MGLSRYDKFCPCGCGKSVRLLYGLNPHSKHPFYCCERCGTRWYRAYDFYRAQVDAGLKRVVPSRVLKYNRERDLEVSI